QASTCCSWPRPSSALATMPRTLPNSSSTSSRVPMCGMLRWPKANPPCNDQPRRASAALHPRCSGRRARHIQLMKKPRVLVVEDESAIAELIAVNLRHNGFEPIWAEDGAAAQREIDAQLPDLILL